MQTINCISNFMCPVEKLSKEKLILTLFGGFSYLGRIQKVITLPCKLGGMGIIDPIGNANDEYNYSRELTSQLANPIIQQEHRYTVSDKNIENCKPSFTKKTQEITP